ncbi:MAG: beta-galactosidase [Oligosphaeraceae bacterium]
MIIHPPYLGSAYYPEDWSDDQLEYDASMMERVGFNVARIGEFAWSRMEREEGVFTFDWLHRVIDTLASHGIATILGTPTATPPIWLSQSHPEVLQERESGVQVNHGGRRHCCSNQPHYIEASARIVERMAQEFADDPNVIGWQIDNEIYVGGMGCFCPACAAGFKEWLKREYGTIEELNHRWNLTIFSQEYSDFDQIPLPRNAWVNPHHKQAWLTFQHQSNSAFVTMQADILKRHVKVPVGTDIMPVNGMNYAKLHEKLDVVQFNHYNSPWDLWHACLWFDICRCLKPRPFWNTETSTCWNGATEVTMVLKPDGFSYANSFLPLALGGEANLYWLWRTHWGGHELVHGSVLAPSGRPMHIFEEVQRTAADFRKAADFLNGTTVRTAVAIHFPSHSWNLFLSQNLVRGFNYQNDFRNSFYKPLTDSAQRPDVFEPSHSLDGYRLLLSPFVCHLDDDTAARIRAWVEQGGVWVVGPMTDIRTSDGTHYQDRPFGCLEQLLDVTWDYNAPDVGDDLRAVCPDGTPFGGRLWYELFEPMGDVLATISASPHSSLLGKAVALKRQLGKGTVILLGTIPTPETMTSRIIPLALQAAGLPAPQHTPNLMVAPRRGDDGREGLVLVEYAGKGDSYRLDRPAHDLIADQDLEPGTLRVQPYQTLVLQYR